MQRRQRLSRSRDFDVVYRQGRSASTRHLVLHWFPRDDGSDEPRLGLAVPRSVGNAVTRNGVKRKLRAAWDELGERILPGKDYVLVARPGLAEVVQTQGQGWLVDQVADVLGKAAA